MGSLADKITLISIALIIAFVVLSTILIPVFRTTYEEGFGTATRDDTTDIYNEYCIEIGSVTTCADCNNTDETTAGYELFLSSCHSLVSRLNGTHCYACNDWGFKTESRGLLLLIFVMGLVALALIFIKR